MRKLQDTNPIRHALIWIAVYIIAVNIGDALGEMMGFRELTNILLVGLSIVLLAYLRIGGRLTFYGIRSLRPRSLPLALYYLPLIVVAFLQYAKGLAPGLEPRDILFAVLLVTAVGFIEELLFRGFLLQALRTRGTLTRAVIISGATFGIGHLVNLLRGYTMTDQALQVVAAILIGIALAYCVVLTGSILPGFAFHALFNLSGTITNHSVLWDSTALAIIAVLVIPYILFLRARLARFGPAGDPIVELPNLPRPSLR